VFHSHANQKALEKMGLSVLTVVFRRHGGPDLITSLFVLLSLENPSLAVGQEIIGFLATHMFTSMRIRLGDMPKRSARMSSLAR
jgi:hypothetical protein